MNELATNETLSTSMRLDNMRAHASDAAQLLKALANDHRLMILCVLAENEASVNQLN